MTPRRLLQVAGVPSLIVGLLLVASAARQSTGQDFLRVRQPQTWVPFSAELVVTQSDASERRYSRYRAADGSSATYPVPSGPLTLHNRRSGRTYVLGMPGQSGWASYPILPESSGQPPQVLTLDSTRSAPTERRLNGLPVYEVTSPSGAVTRIASGLNGLVVFSRQASGIISEDTNILVGPPPDHLFAPPAGVEVNDLKEVPPAILRAYQAKYEGYRISFKSFRGRL